ncbi:MAG: tetraacyldisaccharide 4'-kinase [Bacteroidales bacterium]
MNVLLFLLYPFALLYGLVMYVRNKLYDWGILKSVSFNLPVISVGNLSTGGTGKTPHVEYLVRLLQADYRLATLSRGYRRSTSGYRLATANSTTEEVGDEPLQIRQKFNKLTVAVDENRVHGVKELLKQKPPPEVVILDDAFQHRRIRPGLSILLTDFHKLYPEDYPLPVGSLREFRIGARRADIIIVTKTAPILSPITVRRITGLIKPKPHQSLYFSYLKYGNLIPLPGQQNPELPDKISSILLFAGIANMYPLVEHVMKLTNHLDKIRFGDHHKYSEKDLKKIRQKFESIFTKNKIIVTTEKDAMRLSYPQISPIIADLPVFYIPIEVKMHLEYRKEYKEQILEYVRENSRNN